MPRKTPTRAAKKTSRDKFLAAKLREPFHDIMKDGVTYSFLSEWLLCREQARLSYVEGYTSTDMVDALQFGSIIHKCLEESAASSKSSLSAITALAVRTVDAYVSAARRNLKPTDRSQLTLLGEQAKLVFPAYWSYWQTRTGQYQGLEHRKGVRFLAQELPFEVPHHVPSGRTITLRGRIDGLLEVPSGDHSAAGLWLMEDKTKSQIDEEGLTASLSQDLQSMLYSYAISLIYNRPIAGILYNVIRRPGLRHRQGESDESLLQRIKADIDERPDFYFKRWHVTLDEKDVPSWVERSLNPILEQVLDWWSGFGGDPLSKPFSNPLHFVNPEGLYNRYGKSRYFDLLTRRSSYGLTRRKK